jgi:hypothetical protein
MAGSQVMPHTLGAERDPGRGLWHHLLGQGDNMKLVTLLVTSVLVFVATGCASNVGMKATSSTGGSATMAQTQAPISDAQAAAAKALARDYLSAIQSGSHDAAAALFVDPQAPQVESVVSRDLAAFRANPESMIFSGQRLRWLDGGVLVPRDDGAASDETSIVVSLGGQNGTVIVLKLFLKDGHTIRFFAVERDGRFRLVP